MRVNIGGEQWGEKFNSTTIMRGLVKRCRQIQPRFCSIYAILLKAINQGVCARVLQQEGGGKGSC